MDSTLDLQEPMIPSNETISKFIDELQEINNKIQKYEFAIDYTESILKKYGKIFLLFRGVDLYRIAATKYSHDQIKEMLGL